jgi:hypothetical protein
VHVWATHWFATVARRSRANCGNIFVGRSFRVDPCVYGVRVGPFTSFFFKIEKKNEKNFAMQILKTQTDSPLTP